MHFKTLKCNLVPCLLRFDWAVGWTIRNLVSCMGKRFLFSQKCPDRFWGPPRFLFIVYLGFCFLKNVQTGSGTHLVSCSLFTLVFVISKTSRPVLGPTWFPIHSVPWFFIFSKTSRPVLGPTWLPSHCVPWFLLSQKRPDRFWGSSGLLFIAYFGGGGWFPRSRTARVLQTTPI